MQLDAVRKARHTITAVYVFSETISSLKLVLDRKKKDSNRRTKLFLAGIEE